MCVENVVKNTVYPEDIGCMLRRPSVGKEEQYNECAMVLATAHIPGAE